jgi:hypothetical protein
MPSGGWKQAEKQPHTHLECGKPYGFDGCRENALGEMNKPQIYIVKFNFFT